MMLDSSSDLRHLHAYYPSSVATGGWSRDCQMHAVCKSIVAKRLGNVLVQRELFGKASESMSSVERCVVFGAQLRGTGMHRLAVSNWQTGRSPVARSTLATKSDQTTCDSS